MYKKIIFLFSLSCASLHPGTLQEKIKSIRELYRKTKNNDDLLVFMPFIEFIATPRVTFRDVTGLDDAKEEFMPLLHYFENPQQFNGTQSAPNKGYILTGPCRTGKSYIAQALAGEIKEMYKRQGKDPYDFSFFTIHASVVIHNGVDEIIKQAQQHAPCMVLIEEVELLGLQRAGSNDELLSKFLSSACGVLDSDPDKAVIIIAETNKPQNLDRVLYQMGKLGKEIRFEYPSFEDRKKFLIRCISRFANIDSFYIDRWADKTAGLSYAGITDWVLHNTLREL